MVKTFIFDIAEVICHVPFEKIRTGAARKFGVDENSIHEYYKTNLPKLLTGEIPYVESINQLGLATQYSEEETMNIWVSEIVSHAVFDQKMLSLLSRLRKDYQVVALTNLSWERYQADLYLSIYDHFDDVTLSVKEGLRKPNPKFFELALSKSNTKPEEAVFIDDNPRHTAAASEIGIHGIHFINYEQLIVELKKLNIST